MNISVSISASADNENRETKMLDCVKAAVAEMAQYGQVSHASASTSQGNVDLTQRTSENKSENK